MRIIKFDMTMTAPYVVDMSSNKASKSLATFWKGSVGRGYVLRKYLGKEECLIVGDYPKIMWRAFSEKEGR
jgi:hypothetical protein